MSASNEHDGERLAPVTFLPGVAAHTPAPRVPASRVPPGPIGIGGRFAPDDAEGWFDPGADDGTDASDGTDADHAADANDDPGFDAAPDAEREPRRAREATTGSRSVRAARVAFRDAGADVSADADVDFDAGVGGGDRPESELEGEPDAAARLAAAIDLVARKLRARGLSEHEVRGALAAAGVDRDVAEAAVQTLTERGWLSDAVLAEQLVHGAVTRKGMGRRAIAQLLATRGIDRAVAAAAVAELPDDDAERALEFARDKARTLIRYDDATATRRLLGQLARRGFGGSQASAAVRTALSEARREAGGRSRGVRFE